MEKLRAKLLAFPAADLQLFTKAKRRLQKIFHQDRVEFVDKNPEVLVFLTGGSERVALQSVQEYGYYLLLASSEDNSWAAATEVKAWMNQNNITSHLVDHTSPSAIDLVENFHKVKNGIRQLKGQRFGLIGETSDWLVNSSVDPFLIKSKLGIDQVNIPWNKVDVTGQKDIAPDFLSFFRSSNQAEVFNSGKVYEALSQTIRSNDLNAITVECFSLIESCNSTACLALSKLSMDGIPAGCEGDTCSLLGMMISKEIFGITPWIANIAHVKKNRLTLAHCTIPANLLSGFEIDTHFETEKGLAIKGSFKAEEVTLIRLDHTLSKIFVGYGRVVDVTSRKGLCRTQVVLEISDEVSNYFLNNPLGNHHLVFPGNFVLGFEIAARMLRMEIVK
jgi:L-fucose isomerase-like protein